jgi:hypothetical protein
MSLLVPSQAAAQPSAPAASNGARVTVEGRIVGEEEGHWVVDVGARLGASAGETGELWRPVQMRHPVTKRVVKDRYRIGSVRITEALQVLSFADVEGEPRQKPRPGDIVVLRVERPEPPSPSAGKAEPARAVAVHRDPDLESVAALVDSLRGKVLGARIELLETWLHANPTNRHAAAIREELGLLKHFASAVERPSAASFGEPSQEPVVAPPLAFREPPSFVAPPSGFEPPRVERFVPPEEAFSGAPLDIGVDVSGELNGAILHSRHVGEVSYTATPMRSAGTDFWVATVEGTRVRAPGLDYFVEIVRVDGVAVPALGDQDRPLHVVVRDMPKPKPPSHHRSTASAYTDYADYNRLRGNDRSWQTEGYVGMRFNEIGLRALRTGFGVYRGVGGAVGDLDIAGLAPRNVGLTYGYLEGEAGISPTLSIIGRGAVGLRDEGVSGGGQLHLRIGNDLETNLLLGGEVLGGIGLRGGAEFQIMPQGRVPVMARIEVTNQPGGELGTISAAPGESPNRAEAAVRLIFQPGYRILPPLVVFMRLSAQGRTINHFGPGIGGGATFEW